jgi:hypothetical protein
MSEINADELKLAVGELAAEVAEPVTYIIASVCVDGKYGSRRSDRSSPSAQPASSIFNGPVPARTAGARSWFFVVVEMNSCCFVRRSISDA